MSETIMAELAEAQRDQSRASIRNMEASIEHMRVEQEHWRVQQLDWRRKAWRETFQIVFYALFVAAALLGAGVALGNYLSRLPY